MTVRNTNEMGSWVSSLDGKLTEVIAVIEEQFPASVQEGFAQGLMEAGLDRSQADEYSSSMMHWIKSMKESVADAHRCGAAAGHVVSAVCHRSRRNVVRVIS